MPEAFKRCVNMPGSKVVTIKPKPGKYLHVCYDKQGKVYSGEVKTKKETK